MEEKAKPKLQKRFNVSSVPETVAVLIDGGFFLKRYKSVIPGGSGHTPVQIANTLVSIANRHVGDRNKLYRILYYDCVPFDKKQHNPITKKVVDFGKSEQSKFRKQFFEELKKKRKVALRLGFLKDSGNWVLRPNVLKELLNRTKTIEDITENDVYYDLRQKSIDMKIGVDISTLTLKKFVDRIILISGDADFVPASKLARREGIDFILDPMWNPIDDTLFEHIDGLKTMVSNPKRNQK